MLGNDTMENLPLLVTAIGEAEAGNQVTTIG